MNHRLEGSLVRLRPVERRDLETMRAARNSPEVARYYESREPITEAGQIAWFESMSRNPNAHYFVVENHDAVFVGVANVKNVNPTHRHADYGVYTVRTGSKQSANPLVAVEAAMLVLDFAFDELNLHKVFGNILRTNDRSRKFNEGLGFVEEGILREHAWIDGAWADLVQVALFRPAYTEATAKYRGLLSRMKRADAGMGSDA